MTLISSHIFTKGILLLNDLLILFLIVQYNQIIVTTLIVIIIINIALIILILTIYTVDLFTVIAVYILILGKQKKTSFSKKQLAIACIGGNLPWKECSLYCPCAWKHWSSTGSMFPRSGTPYLWRQWLAVDLALIIFN